ncbi:hypothetical protein Q8F55_000769 [Vanrija albida]|uniref:Uncharacterized protein n=1 Tax=Vanrija albida TaxID=181172 RepID=A0ABR3QE83_9TREE
MAPQASSDPFDDDDDFFADPAALSAIAAIEERALSASQAPRKAGSSYHHQVARPGAGPRSAAASTSARGRPPAPLRTNPETRVCGFGWETGGKHASKHAAAQAARPAAIDEESPPTEFVLGADGRYGLAPGSGDDEPIIDRPATAKSSDVGRANSDSPASRPVRRATFGAFDLDNFNDLHWRAQRATAGARADISALELKAGGPWRDEVQSGGDAADDIAKLQQQLWAAQGQAANAVRAKQTLETQLKAEIDRLRASARDMENQIKQREHDAKQKVESMKTQVAFSSHLALASASKAKQQSQWAASQRAGAPTPMRTGSPLRDKTMVTPAPLSRSAKGKARIPPPRFDGLSNAFHQGPGSRTKRQRTEMPSPSNSPNRTPQMTTPTKRQRSMSPAVLSPIQSQGSQGIRPPTPRGEGEGMDWEPDVATGLPDVSSLRDPKAELVHHILNHVVLSPLQVFLDYTNQPTILRIVSQPTVTTVPVVTDGHAPWKDLCSDLLRLCSDTELSFEELSPELVRVLSGMVGLTMDLTFCGDSLGAAGARSMLCCLISACRLVSSTLLLFPTLLHSNVDAAASMVANINWMSEFIGHPDANGGELDKFWLELEKELDEAADKNGGALVNWSNLAAEQRPSRLWRAEFADSLAELAEAICMSEGKSVWTSDELAHTIIMFVQSDHAATVVRGLGLFVVAACRQDHFRPLLFPVKLAGGSDAHVIDRVARFLASGHKDLAADQSYRVKTDILSALFMLAAHDPDAIVLLTEKSVLVPALLTLLHRESSRIWGVRGGVAPSYNALSVVAPTIALLHHMVYPAPLPKTNAASQAPDALDDPDAHLFAGTPPQAVDLARRLQEASSTNEFNGIQHVFVSALGALAYGNVDVDDGAWGLAARPPGDHPPSKRERAREAWLNDIRTIQFLAQDLLEAVVEGPEGDSVYEMYEEEGGSEEAGAGAGAAREMDVDDDYDEEQRVMEGEWVEDE